MAFAISSGLAIYFVLWWIVLFAVLPFGVRTQSESGDDIPGGSDPGAPVAPGMGRKLLWTTLISIVIYGVAMLAYVGGYLNIAWWTNLVGMPMSK
jgi:predicted secreted protein